MKRTKILTVLSLLLIALLVLVLPACDVGGGVQKEVKETYTIDDFEGYADDTALHAVWKNIPWADYGLTPMRPNDNEVYLSSAGREVTLGGSTNTGEIGKDGSFNGAKGLAFFYKSDMGLARYYRQVDRTNITAGNALSFWVKSEVSRGEFWVLITDTDGNEYKLIWAEKYKNLSSTGKVYIIEFTSLQKERGHTGTLSYSNIEKIEFQAQYWPDKDGRPKNLYEAQYIYIDDISVVVYE